MEAAPCETADTPSRRDLVAGPTENNFCDDEVDVMGPAETNPASPSDHTLLTQEFPSPAASASSAATRSSRRSSRNGNGGSRVDKRSSHPDNNDHAAHPDNSVHQQKTAFPPQDSSSSECLTQDPNTARQDQAVDNHDGIKSPTAQMATGDDDDNNTNKINNDDDDEEVNSATSFSDDDVSSEEDDKPNNLSLMDRRKRNMERNQLRLNNIGLEYGMTAKRKRSVDKTTESLNDKDLLEDPGEPTKRRGMLLTTAVTTVTTVPEANGKVAVVDVDDLDGISSLQRMFPHRQAPIRKLYSLLATAASQSGADDISCSGPEARRFVPAPIFVTGSSGSGKTAVLRATVQAIEKGNRVRGGRDSVKVENDGTQVVSAYINCATLDDPTIGELVTNAHNQFLMGVRKLSGNAKAKGRSKRYKRKSSSVVTDQVTSKRKSLSSEQSTPSVVTKPIADSTENAESALQQDNTEAPVRKTRSNHYRSSAPSTRRKDSTETTDAPKIKAAKTRVFAASEDMAVSSETWSTEHTAVWAFGRTLASLFKDRHAGFLILDQAERLLSLSPTKGTSERNNFLSQLLFLPRVAGLNLTVIVVTNSLLLEHSRLNNLVSAHASLGTIAADLQPLRIHFSAYRGKSIIKEILRRPMLQRLIIGDDFAFSDVGSDAGFKQTVFRSFLDTLVQSVHDLTSDIKEFVRLGRSLWPKYVEPLRDDSINTTIESARKALEAKGGSSNPHDSVQRQILTILDRRIFPEVRRVLQRGVFTLEFDSPFVLTEEPEPASREQHEMPPLSKYLLLAAFICQHNRPDRDKHLFSIQKNGKRRRSTNGENNNGGDLAFGSSSQQPKTLRPRSFPLERMLSVYVSTIGLNQSLASTDGNIDRDERLRSLGTSTFNESLAHLRDIGLLHEPPSRTVADALRMNDAMYWCSLTLDEAQGIAKSVNFPLDRYIF